jgi:hypothetical protein
VGGDAGLGAVSRVRGWGCPARLGGYPRRVRVVRWPARPALPGEHPARRERLVETWVIVQQEDIWRRWQWHHWWPTRWSGVTLGCPARLERVPRRLRWTAQGWRGDPLPRYRVLWVPDDPRGGVGGNGGNGGNGGGGGGPRPPRETSSG